LKNYSICINDREILQDYSKDIITTIDKLDKISVDGVVSELVNRNLVKTEVEAKQLISGLHEKKMTERLEQLWTYLQKFGLDKNHLVFQPTLARGLDYYTSTIFEIKIAGYSAGSVCGGGRYDDLIGMFTETKIPAVGFAFGFDRLIEALTEQKLLPILETNSTALVIPFSNTELDACIEIMKQLQTAGINAELYLEPDVKLDKKLKYADKKGVPYVVIIGPDEVIQKTATVKNLKTKQQETLPVAKLPHAIIQS
jgi:histidyl-tRNA synthetase